MPPPEGRVDEELPEAPMPEVVPETEPPELGVVLDVEGVIDPAAEPPADPRPEAEPVADPDIDGPEPQADRAAAQARARISLVIGTPCRNESKMRMPSAWVFGKRDEAVECTGAGQWLTFPLRTLASAHALRARPICLTKVVPELVLGCRGELAVRGTVPAGA